MAASKHEDASQNPVRPGDFARILLAAGGSPPRARARDQQADVTGESLRQHVLNRLIVLDPDPEELESALLVIIAEYGDPAGPIRGVCTAIRQEWDMAHIQPEYWTFLVSQAVEAAKNDSGRRARQQT